MEKKQTVQLQFTMSFPEFMVRLMGAILKNAPEGAIEAKAHRIRIKDRRGELCPGETQ